MYPIPSANWPDIRLDTATPPTLTREGRKWFGWGGGRPFLGEHTEAYQRLAARGVRQFHTDATCAEDIYHPELRFWHAPDTFGSKAQEENFARLLKVCPDALLQLRIYAGCPDWWVAAHPGECQVYGDGSDRCTLQRSAVERLPSLASPLWRKELCSAMRRYVRWLIDRGWSKHVSALFVCYGITWEWGILGSDRFPDYSQSAQLYFRDWLREKYLSEESLSRAWGRDLTFASASIPGMDRRMAAGRGRALRPLPDFADVVDYQLCLSDMNADLLLALCEAAREESEGEVLIGTFYGYTLTAREQTEFTGRFGAGGFHGGHHALGRVLRSNSVDFIGSPFSYADRSLGSGLLLEHVPLASLHAHKKAFFDESDLRAYNNREESDVSTISVGQTESLAETLKIFRSAFGQAIVRGKHQWLYELTGWLGRFQENFSDPVLLAEIARLNTLSEELVERDRLPVTEMAFVLDEQSVAWLPLDSREFVEHIYHGSILWGHLGAPFDIILLDDLLELDPAPYRLVVAGCIKSPHALGAFQEWCARHTNTRSLWDGTAEFFPPLDPGALLDAMRGAGVHRYANAPITVWANSSMVFLHNSHEGLYTINFLKGCRGLEVFSGRRFDASCGRMEWPLQAADVALFVIDPV